MAGAAVAVTLTGVSKHYGAVPAVRDVSLTINPGEIVSLLGPSGCGKTTTLRMIAGLERPDSGEIRIGATTVNDLPPWRRNIGMVFQSYALFPHMTVAENVAFGLTMRGVGRERIQAEVADAMRLVRLTGLEHRRPSQLSGGQRQRVALARALVTKPSVLLLDEPLAALDKKLRDQMQVEIKQLQRTVNVTTVFVTHDQEEALTLSDRLVVMDAGKIIQIGTPTEVYEHPQSRFVSDFIGLTNAIGARVTAVDGEWAIVATNSGDGLKVRTSPGVGAGDVVELMIRPEKIALHPLDAKPDAPLRGTIESLVYTGAVTYYRVKVGGDTVTVMVPSDATSQLTGALSTDCGVALTWNAEHAKIFPVINR